MARVWSRHQSGNLKVGELPKLGIRATPESNALLEALALAENRPMWKIVDDAVQLYEAHRHDSEGKSQKTAHRSAHSK